MTKIRWAWVLPLLALTGCSRQSSDSLSNAVPVANEVPKGAEGFLEKQLGVDTLFFTEDGKQIIAPGNRQGVIVQPGNGNLAWAAWQCDNSQCPGRKPDGKPQLFPWPNPFLYVKDDGTVATRQPITEAELLQADENRTVRCPACLKIRNLASETPEQRRQYQSWCRPHVLPQAVEQRKKLDEEYRRLRGGS